MKKSIDRKIWKEEIKEITNDRDHQMIARINYVCVLINQLRNNVAECNKSKVKKGMVA